MIADCDFDAILFAKQKLKIKKQFMKDYYSHLKKNLGLNKKGPKLRSGVFALFKEKFVQVNGFDEKYKGWGNEDDDLGHRLYAAGVNGFNPFWNEYPLHLFHEANHESGKRVNAEYYNERKRIINEGNFTCQFGLENPNDDEEIFFLEIN